jgi:ATP-dependent Zn protease
MKMKMDQLLTEIDGLGEVIIAVTNNLNFINPVLSRPE